jgi:hypothetical protein
VINPSGGRCSAAPRNSKTTHGDNGAGIGASHQTGWTGLVATLIEVFGHLDAKSYLETGRAAAFDLE